LYRPNFYIRIFPGDHEKGVFEIKLISIYSEKFNLQKKLNKIGKFKLNYYFYTHNTHHIEQQIKKFNNNI